MLVVVSPAKNLDFETPVPVASFTRPAMLSSAEALVETCRKLTPADLSSLMKISDKLATLNANRFDSFTTPFTKDNARQALYAFNGDVYTGLDAYSLSEQDVEYAQQHLRMLSGLYGLLRPLDLMQPYRLEMGTRLENPKGKNLYEFWGTDITLALNKALEEQGDNILINLASNEYFKSVKAKSLDGMIITPHFKDKKNGQYKVISFFAKKARGLMARYVIQNRIEDVAGLKAFSEAGYVFSLEQSTETDLVFLRDEAE
ncbi:peroxide stress protein YaaA [Alteromonas sp. 1_MG-2023]|uniref:peroxide stress protein YaaA n=1 Tax=Alteromonas sp. 1_MG-2023 TaxID=3062669 RepID=UPI0026E3984A|nr:peroxide stress protein YaaA [Alteromonas sp. 1_MG-2023]MDO6474708.1 peroxide stress protein YaaA [Alteromonas sp. 1_MG-2023]